MAKNPQPGHVKTRLIGPQLGATQAAAVAQALLRCTARRLVDRFERVILAVAPDDRASHCAESLGLRFHEVLGQGDGALGARMARIWQRTDAAPVAFFGMDAPDVPGHALDAIREGVSTHDVAIGPTRDGGYWALAARRYQPVLLEGIAWGSDGVYSTTLKRAAAAGLGVRGLLSWYDVDARRDLIRLRERLRRHMGGDAALEALARDLAAILDTPNTQGHRA